MQHFYYLNCQYNKFIMKIICIVILCSIVVFSCKKSDKLQYQTCNNTSKSIIGRWALIGTTYTMFGNSNWVAADNSHPVFIEFKSDSTFSYTNNFIFSYGNYDRFTTDSAGFKIYSSSNSPTHYSIPIPFNMISPNEIKLTNLGVDTYSQETFVYSCP